MKNYSYKLIDFNCYNSVPPAGLLILGNKLMKYNRSNVCDICTDPQFGDVVFDSAIYYMQNNYTVNLPTTRLYSV